MQSLSKIASELKGTDKKLGNMSAMHLHGIRSQRQIDTDIME
jgi:hypothetical protein